MKPSCRGRFEGAHQKIVAEYLRRLRHHQLFARHGGAHPHVGGAASHLLDGIDRGHRHDRRAGLGRLVEDLVNRLQIDERTHRVVHRHQFVLRAERASAFSTDSWRLLPPSTTRTRPLANLLAPASRGPIRYLRRAPRSRSRPRGRDAANLRTVCIRIGEPSSSMNCLRLVPAFSAVPLPIRVPRPAAGNMTATFM